MAKEAFPLSWPDGWVRARPQHRRGNSNWKKTFGAYRDHLVDEIERLKATTLVISTNIPLTLKGMPREGFNPPDPGVAVYFSRKAKEDFTWQDVFALGASPSIEDVDRRFRELSKKYHPDVRGGDVEMFRMLVRSRDAAYDYLLHRSRDEHEYVLACDLFREVRLNMHAIALTVEAMRQIERCGASSMLERAFRGFMAALPAKGETA
jgi:hypothetical protein